METIKKERMEMLTNMRRDIFQKLHRTLSRHDVTILKIQYIFALDRANPKQCTGYLARVYVVPCAHVIFWYIDLKGAIEV